MDYLEDKLPILDQFNYDELLNLVDEISKHPEADQNKCWELLVKQEFLENQLNKVVSNPDPKLIEFIADSCKNIICRKFFTKDFLIKFLLGLLDSNDFDLVKQTCRTIVNICYENSIACRMIYKNKGIKKIVQLLKLNNLKLNVKEDEISLKKIILGCILNILNDSPEYQEVALDNDLLDIMTDVLEMEKNKLNQDSIVFKCILIFFSFLDNESSIECLKNSNLIFNLIDEIRDLNKLKTIDQIDFEVVETIVDLFTQLSENEEENEIKLKLVEKGIIEILTEILDHELIEDEQLLKTSSNLIVILVSDDQIAKKYYNNGKGYAYLKAKKWLNSYIQKLSEDKDVLNEKENLITVKAESKNQTKENIQLSTGVLIIGNFSNTNEASVSIAKDGLIEKLVKIIELNKDFTVQFACLSTLRNLAIADLNKKYFVVNGLLTILLRIDYSESPSFTFNCAFKFLAILRFITDKQPDAAFEILNNLELIENLKLWGNLNSLPGVKAEASRLLASLLKNLENINFNYDHLMDKRLLKLLFEMINSKDLRMQNEAINGIGFLIDKFNFNQVVKDLLNEKTFLSDIKNLIKIYKDKEELNEFEFKFVQNILSVLSFSHLKYQLELDSELYDHLENLKHSNLTENVKIVLKLKGN